VTLNRDSLRRGEAAQASAEGRDASGKAVEAGRVEWSSSNAAVATVSHTGLVTSTGAGEALIAGTVGTLRGEARVRVFVVPVNAVVVTPLRSVLPPGGTTRLSAVTVDATGSPLLGRAIAWLSSDTLRADVDETGLVTARNPGVVSISALSEGVYTSVDVRVSGPPGAVATVTMVPAGLGLTVGQSGSLSTVLEDADGNEATDRDVTWQSLTPAIATVTPQGVVTGLARGTAQIRATSEGKVGIADVTVVDLADSISVSFAEPVKDDIVGDTLYIFANVESRNRIVRVMARLSSNERREVELVETPVGTMGTRFAWTGRLDVVFLHYGPYQVVLTAWDELGNSTVATQPFKRGTREGKGGTTLPPRNK